ncbi:MAG: 8-amino-7-oxononanoate synthase [Nitrospirota bacterium]
MPVLSEKLKILKEKSLLREIKDRESPQGPRVQFGGREYINFSSNDYLGLANHPYIIDKAKKAMDNYGHGSAASRLLGGGSILHKELEERIAQFKGTEAALVFNSGYAANTGIIPTIADEDTAIFSDELNHASIIDGCRLSKAKTLIYRHRDLSHLEELIKKEDAKKKIVITDTVFSMDGDIAPLKEIYSICASLNSTLSTEHSTLLYIDDAHGTGVLGNGRGALAHFHIKPEPWIIQMGTFSKALGSFGGFVAGSRDVIEWILNTARSFIFSTALPSCIIAASIAAVELIENDSELIKRLWENRNKVADGIKELGYDIMGSETPIIPLKTGTIEETLRVSRHLYEKGIFAPAIRPPTVKEPRIRITVTAAHTDEDIERLIEALSI